MSLRKPFQPAAFSHGSGVAGWLVPVPSCSAAWPFWGWLWVLLAGQLWGRSGGLPLTGWGCTQSRRRASATLHPGRRFLTTRYQRWFLHPPLSGQSPSEQHGLCGRCRVLQEPAEQVPSGREPFIAQDFLNVAVPRFERAQQTCRCLR